MAAPKPSPSAAAQKYRKCCTWFMQNRSGPPESRSNLPFMMAGNVCVAMLAAGHDPVETRAAIRTVLKDGALPPPCR
jgi:hypothetical protein